MKVTAITQARSGSTRLPRKIFMEIAGKSLLEIHLTRLKLASRVNNIIVATTTNNEDSAVCDVADRLGLGYFRGSENDVLDRFYQACKNTGSDYIVRVTSDCPLVDPALIDNVIDRAIHEKADYCSNVLKETFPDGQDIEVFTFAALERAWREAKLQSDREHVTPYIRKNADFNGGTLFKAVDVTADQPYGGVRMTVDEMADFDVIKDLVMKLGTGKTWREYADYIQANKNVADKNTHITRNEGYTKSLKNDKVNEQPL